MEASGLARSLEALPVSGVLQNIDRYEVVFDDEGLVADAGLLAAGTLMSRLGLEDLVDSVVSLDGRVGGANPGRKVCTLVSAMLVGASHIDHVDRLRAGSTQRVLPHTVMAPSTVGTFLRSFTWGHVRQLEKVLTVVLGRAWRAGAGPGKGPVTVDLDSTICPVSGKTKQGGRFSVTPKSWVITRCWRSGRTPGRWSEPACGQEHLSGVWCISRKKQ